MNEFSTMLNSEKDKEVVDPVSGHYFPKSFSDIKAEKAAKMQANEAEANQKAQASMIASLFK